MKRQTFLLKAVKYALCLTAGALIAALVLFLRGYFTAEGLVDRYRCLADAFTVAGLMLVMVSALVWAGGEGAFDGLGYALNAAVRFLVPFVRPYGEKYADYRARKHSGGKPAGYSCLFYSGLFFQVAAVAFIILFYSAS